MEDREQKTRDRGGVYAYVKVSPGGDSESLVPSPEREGLHL